MLSKNELNHEEYKLNSLRKQFVSPSGLLDWSVLKKYRRELNRLTSSGYSIVLNDETNTISVIPA